MFYSMPAGSAFLDDYDAELWDLADELALLGHPREACRIMSPTSACDPYVMCQGLDHLLIGTMTDRSKDPLGDVVARYRYLVEHRRARPATTN